LSFISLQFLKLVGVTGVTLVWSCGSFIIEELGWQSLFYIAGGMGMLWLVPWLLFTSDGPLVNNSICLFPPSEEEIEYIISNQDKINNTTNLSVPWKRILTSPPVLVLALNQFTGNWIFYIWASWLPTFYETKFLMQN